MSTMENGSAADRALRPGTPWPRRIWRLVRRTLLGVFGLQVLLAAILTLVDSWRRRGKRPQPFETLPPQTTTVGDDTLTVYTIGVDLYDDMLAAIDGARESILLETYIWKDDEIGRLFKQALIDAADRGVRVHIIYDAFANLVVPRAFKRFPPGLQVLRYPIYNAGLRFWDLRHYGRNHRKVLIVDGAVAFIGGYNIGSAYATAWRDTHCRVTGAGALDLERSFIDFWNDNRRRLEPLRLPASDGAWDARIRVHRNLPRQWMFPIRAMYLEAIRRSSHRVWLTHAYFIPDEDFVAALIAAAQRDVDVRILLPRTSNHVVADWLSRGYFTQLLEAGVTIHRFEGAMVHAKTATIDSNWSTVGTANIDRLSMTGNYEVNLEVIDPETAAVLEEIFLSDLAQSSHLTLRDWRSRGFHRRFTEGFLRPLRHLL